MSDTPHVPFTPPTPPTPRSSEAAGPPPQAFREGAPHSSAEGHAPQQGQGGGDPNKPRRRRRRGGRGRNKDRNGGPGGPGGGQGQRGGSHAPARAYEDEGEDPWATQGDPNAPAAADEAPVAHHPKIELPEAFEKLGLEPAILHGLADINFVTPSEIQEKMIPVALTGVDVLGQARTGTGKTAAFGLPILQKLDLKEPFQAIIVVPTRELAVQVEAEMRRFAKHKPVRFALAYGGTKVQGNLKQLGHQPHVVVGTPGRIMDLHERGALILDKMRFVVCDEVDRMFDIGFRDDIRRILSYCTTPHQTIFVSATISDDIERMVQKHMKDPARIFTANKDEKLLNAEALQFYVGVQPWDKQRAIRMLLKQEKPELAIIFCRTKRSVDKVAAGLMRDGIAASAIHGDLMQNKRERVMRGFKTGKIHVLVATDLASRGIDVHEITHVINFDIPEDPEVYVHRVGRTARMGATGRAFTFVSHGQAQLQTEIEKLTNSLLEEYRIEGFTASPEPSARHRREDDEEAPAYGGGAPLHQEAGGHVHAESSPSTPAAAPADPAAAPVQEGYQPTGFANVQPTKSVRPLTGRFPTKRRR